MVQLGITGGIGMGKSTVARALSARGIPVIDTDDLARQVVAPGSPALEEIASQLGREYVDATEGLRRAAMAQRVFADPAARRILEGITHPRIRDLWQKWLQGQPAGTRIAAVVIPLLYETAAEKLFDKVVCVACSTREQALRLAARGWRPEQAAQRISAQLATQEKMARAHYVIWTEGPVARANEQLDTILSRWELGGGRAEVS